MYDLIVIGGGPAALAATFYAIGKQMNVMMVYAELGGKIGWLQTLAGPGPRPDLPGNELAHLLTLRTTQADHTMEDRVLSVMRDGPVFNVVTDRHGILHSRTVLIATGATPLQLKIPGADHGIKNGLGYSITTYAHLAAGKRVAVIGGTNRALSGAAELADTAAHVYIVAPGQLMLSTPLGHALRQRPHVELLEGWEVTRVTPYDDQINVMIERYGHARELTVHRAFVALGLVPNSAIVRDLVQTDANGFILVNAYHETSLPGLFAAGDVSSRFSEQVLVAIGDGARAATTAYDYVLAQRLVPDSYVYTG